jgi:hypothetical protein
MTNQMKESGKRAGRALLGALMVLGIMTLLSMFSLSGTAQAAVGDINTLVGDGTPSYGGDGGTATTAQINAPNDMAFDSSGNYYIVDTANNRIRMVTPGGIISTVAGNGTPGFSGDDGAATSAQLNAPSSVVVDEYPGNLYISDTGNNRIRKVTPGGIISTFANIDGPRGLAVEKQSLPQLHISSLSREVVGLAS